MLGSHGRKGLERLLMGSLANAVLRHANCSVEIVRIPLPTKGPKRANRPAKGKIRRVLLATDGSKYSEEALSFLMQQVWPQETEVRVLHVGEPLPLLAIRGMSNYESFLKGFREERTKRAADLVARIAEALRGKALKVTTSIVQGEPESKILAAAESWKAELIVLGSLGRTGIERFLIGSVSDAVARHARCSVEIVRTSPSV